MCAESCGFQKLRMKTWMCRVLSAAVTVVFVGACSLERYKAEAAKEVYQIIDDKWSDET